MYHIWDNKSAIQKFYEHYQRTIMVGYNSRGYDQYILKAILCDFNPYIVSQWIIEFDRQGYEFSKLFNNFHIMNYDCMVFGRSLKELEAFLGHNIQETPIPFDIDRPLTDKEKILVQGYCEHDVNETFEVFVETKDSFETVVGLIEEFKLPSYMISKTETQLAAEILGAEYKKRDDEFDIEMPSTLRLGKYQWILDEHFYPWSLNSKKYEEIKLHTDIMGVPHDFGVGGIHGAIKNYLDEGFFLMADVDSYYPACMINYGFLSRNVYRPSKYKDIRDTRIEMKKNKHPRQSCYKLVLNKTFGGSKDKYNKLYDPRQANNLCIANQLFLVDLLDKLEGTCQLIQSNTDGILIKLFNIEDEPSILAIIKEWEIRTGFTMGIDRYSKVVQRDVNNYIIIPSGKLYDETGKELFKRKGSVTKKLSKLDNDLPVVNRAVVDYFVHGTLPEDTILRSTKLIDFQKVTKVGYKYEHAWHNGKILGERVNRCFASVDYADTTLMKQHKSKETLDKVASTPLHCFIDNENILEKSIPAKLDKQWYINLAWERIKEFV